MREREKKDHATSHPYGTEILCEAFHDPAQSTPVGLPTLEHTDEDLEEYVKSACASDGGVAACALIGCSRAHCAMENPEKPVVDRGSTPPFRRSLLLEGPGTIIGPYRLLEQIGEGGFGIVYMAEQLQPVRRKVALKIIKPGMDTRQVVARFEAERQALALMDHPNIARVLDAGATETGRPYFVMELVQGRADHRVLRRERLPTAERLELFVARLPGRAARAPEGDHPPRPQAVQHPGDAARRHARASRSSTSASPRRSASS